MPPYCRKNLLKYPITRYLFFSFGNLFKLCLTFQSPTEIQPAFFQAKSALKTRQETVSTLIPSHKSILELPKGKDHTRLNIKKILLDKDPIE